MANKLNSMRLLEANDVAYEVLEYDTSTRDAEEVAELLGIPDFMVFKTLIAQPVGSGKPVVAVIPSSKQLHLKKLAKVVGEKKMKMAAHAEAEKLTGLQVGGISPLMLLDKNWTIYLDQSATELQHICISAGQRGLQLRIPVMPLMTVINAKLAEISMESD